MTENGRMDQRQTADASGDLFSECSSVFCFVGYPLPR